MSGLPLPVARSVAVVGAGTMGEGIAQVAATAGHESLLYDAVDGAAAAALDRIRNRLDRRVEKGRLTHEEADAICARIVPINSLDGLSGAGLVVEAIVEDLDAKRATLASVESLVGDDAIIATNTSSLSVTALAAHLERPARVLGMHFFNPAPVLPLVEVVTGHETAEEVVQVCHATALAWGKVPVVCASTPGFIVNRVARPFYGEALRLLAEGAANVATIDHVIEGAGRFRMGPFTLMDLVGIDVNLAVSESVYEQTYHEPRFAPNQIQRALVDAGRLGRKSGAGFYDYGEGIEPLRPSTVPAGPPRGPVTVVGDLGWAGVLVDRLRDSPTTIEYAPGPERGHLRVGDIAIVPTDGRTAASLAADDDLGTPDVVVLDLFRPDATRVAVAGSARDASDAVEAAAAVLQSAGLEVSEVDDLPGLAVMRIVCQLASVAADAALLGVAAPADIDLAMRLGTNYPVGPLEWADELGPKVVLEVLDNLQAHYGEDRYRPSPALRRAALTGRTLAGNGGTR